MNTRLEDRLDDVLDLHDLFLRLLARRFSIVACILVSTAGFAAAAFILTPIYRASALVVPAAAERSSLSSSLSSAIGQLGGLASLAGISVDSSDSETQEALAVLESRQFTEAFIRDRGIMPRLFESDWDSVSGGWRGGADDQPTLAEAYKYFDEHIRSTVQDTRSGLVSIHVDWKDRSEAADWANELVRRLNAEMRSRTLNKVEASLVFLQRELASTADIGTREAINRLVEGQVRQRMLANVTEEFAFRIVDPALPPDVGDTIRPPKVLLLALGPSIGLLLGVLLALVLDAFSRGGASASRLAIGP